MERYVKVTVRSTLQVLLRRSVKGSYQGPSRLRPQGTENKGRWHCSQTPGTPSTTPSPCNCDVMTAPHLISFLSPIEILRELFCFIFWESKSMDKFTQSHISYKQTLKNTFLFAMLHPNGCLSWNKSHRHEVIRGPERHLFISSFLYNYLCVRHWERGGGGVCVWNRPPSQSVLEFGNQGNRGLKHSLYWLLANYLKSVQLVILCM